MPLCRRLSAGAGAASARSAPGGAPGAAHSGASEAVTRATTRPGCGRMCVCVYLCVSWCVVRLRVCFAGRLRLAYLGGWAPSETVREQALVGRHRAHARATRFFVSLFLSLSLSLPLSRARRSRGIGNGESRDDGRVRFAVAWCGAVVFRHDNRARGKGKSSRRDSPGCWDSPGGRSVYAGARRDWQRVSCPS